MLDDKNNKNMINWKCRFGIHDYKTIGNQSVTGVVGGFSMSPIMRTVDKCKRCDKVNFVCCDIATNVHLDETLNWQPKLNY